MKIELISTISTVATMYNGGIQSMRNIIMECTSSVETCHHNVKGKACSTNIPNAVKLFLTKMPNSLTHTLYHNARVSLDIHKKSDPRMKEMGWTTKINVQQFIIVN